MKTTDDVLQERGQSYGDFGTGARLEATIIELLAANHAKQTGSPMQIEHIVWFSKIVMKLSRLSVTPEHIDSWTDIAGYGRLVEIELTKRQENQNAQSQ